MENKKLRTPLLDNYYSQLNQNKMTARKMYRIELTSLDYTMARDTAIVAALSNGKGADINLIGLQAYANVKKAEYGYKDVTVSLIGNTLLIDKGTELLLKIEEVEVMELDMPQITAQEAKDLIAEANPVLGSYLKPQGLADNDNHELLN